MKFRIPSQKEISRFYCEGMALGYAAGAHPTPLPIVHGWEKFSLRGYMGYTHAKDKFRLVDTFVFGMTGRRVFGLTAVWFDMWQVLEVTRRGHFDEEAEPCLMSALLTNYQQGVFNVGRGPSQHEHEGFVYNIDANEHQDGTFDAREAVSRKGSNYGFQRISGSWLI